MPHPLTALFNPRSIAVFGASDRPESVGGQVLQNLASSGFEGDLFPINPKHTRVGNLPCYPALADVGQRVDLAIVATPASTAVDIMRQCGASEVAAAIVMSAGFSEVGPAGADLERALVREARNANIQLLGPNCLGAVSTRARMNATFSDIPAQPGSLALVSQSGALCTAIMDWALDLSIGFSSVVSVGDAAGLGFGELLDYLATDESTSAILLYVEGVKDARRFMSGLRAAARLKPTVVLKAGKHEGARKAARSHSGALMGSDAVFDAAIRRAGAVRVQSIGQLFATAQLLAAGHRVEGEHLAIVANAGGPGVMAADHAAQVGVALATLSPKTLARLDSKLAPHWSRGNPVDILGDAGPDAYREALTACLADDAIHGALVILTPQAMTHPTACAQAVLDTAKTSNKPVVACWMGGSRVAEGRQLFRHHVRHHGVPTFSTPEASVDAFRSLWAYRQNQQLLLQVPAPLTFQAHHDVDGARLIINSALSEGRKQLDSVESKALLHAFGIPSTLPIRARNAAEALVAAESQGFPVVLKIDSPDISHKSDVGGVKLGIADGRAVHRAFAALMAEAERAAPEARLSGVTVEPMYAPKHRREVMIGVATDVSFGPAISVGQGGVLVEFADRAIGLPPLNSFVASGLLKATTLDRLLAEWRGQPQANKAAVEEVLLRVSDLVCELPEVRELDINPLVVDAERAVAVDARVVIERVSSGSRAYAHMAIHPYPADLESKQQLADGTEVTVRPIRPEDAEVEQRFVRGLSERSKYFRFMQALNELTQEMLVRFTQIDYDREMAFIAIHETAEGAEEIGVSRYTAAADGTSCEFALVVADAWQGRGVGSRLMEALFGAARRQGLHTMTAEVQTSNAPMLQLVANMGFEQEPGAEPTLVFVTKRL